MPRDYPCCAICGVAELTPLLHRGSVFSMDYWSLGFWSFIVTAYFHCITLRLCPFRAVVSRWQGGCTFSYFHTQDWYWLLCLPGYDWGAFFVNILYLVVSEWCLGVGWVLLFLSPLIICSSIPLRWCCTRIPIGCTWWHWLFKGREWYRHRVLTFMFRGQC